MHQALHYGGGWIYHRCWPDGKTEIPAEGMQFVFFNTYPRMILGGTMPKKVTHADAHLILQLYDLRREAEMRKARNWVATQFWPQSADDYIKVASAFGTPENAWLRQVTSYWDMVAAFVLHGALNEELFFAPGVGNEMLFVFGKVHPFLKEIREKTQSPAAFATVEKIINKSKSGRERFAMISKRVEGMRKAQKA
jgi:hypothetical protein